MIILQHKKDLPKMYNNEKRETIGMAKERKRKTIGGLKIITKIVGTI